MQELKSLFLNDILDTWEYSKHYLSWQKLKKLLI
jgi:hypothetical protein